MTAARDHGRVGAREIADALRARIDSGQLKPGDRLPLTRELVARYGVTGETVRQAVIKLKTAGLVESIQGSGVYVRRTQQVLYRPQAEFADSPTTSEMIQLMAAMSTGSDEIDDSVKIEAATFAADVWHHLQLEEHEQVLLRRHTRQTGGKIINVSDAFYPAAMVKGSDIATRPELPEGDDAILKALGREPARALDEIYIKMPTPEQTKSLKLLPGTPVAIHHSTSYSADGHPVRTIVSVLPGDRNVIAFERSRSTSA